MVLSSALSKTSDVRSKPHIFCLKRGVQISRFISVQMTQFGDVDAILFPPRGEINNNNTNVVTEIRPMDGGDFHKT